MQELKVGDFVWHEEYGKGMCVYVYTTRRGEFNILFEGKDSQFTVTSRKTLFKKGDLVVGENGSFVNIKGTFLGWIDSCEHNNFLIVNKGIGVPIKYCSSIKHQEQQEQITLNLQINGKEITPLDLSEETWLKLRDKK